MRKQLAPHALFRASRRVRTELAATTSPERVLELLNELGEDVHGPVIVACADALARIAKTEKGRKECVKWCPEPDSEFGMRPPRKLLDQLSRLSKTPVKKRNDAVAPAVAICNALLAMAKLEKAREIIYRVKRSPVHEVVPRLLPKISHSRDAVLAALKLVQKCLPPPPPPRKQGPTAPWGVPWPGANEPMPPSYSLYSPPRRWYSHQQDMFSERPFAEALAKLARSKLVKRSTRTAATLASVVDGISGEKPYDSRRANQFSTAGGGQNLFRHRLTVKTTGFAAAFASLIHEPAVRASAAAAGEFATAVHHLAKSEACALVLIEAGAPAVLIELATQP